MYGALLGFVLIMASGSGIVGDSGQVYLTGVPEKGHIVAS